MANTIKIKRGLKENLPTLAVGEQAYCTDTNELFIGTTTGNVLVNPETDLSSYDTHILSTSNPHSVTTTQIGAEPAFTKNTAFNKNFGNTAGTVTQGNDARLSDARTPTSHNHPISDVTGLQSALDSKTTESYVDTKISNLVDSSPATLNTLNELANALGDDPNFATTVSNEIGTKVSSSLLSVTAGANTVAQRDSSGNLTTAGQLNFANNDGFVYNDTTNIMYVKKDGTDREIITDDTIGSQSVNFATSSGNANTLDGIDSSQFLRSDTTDTMSGRLEMANILDMNNNNINGVNAIYHHDDTNTYTQFHSGDQWRVVTGGSERLEVNNSAVTVQTKLVGKINEVNGNVGINFWTGTQAQYDAIGTKSSTTLYFITE